jgi:hypothetical protein
MQKCIIQKLAERQNLNRNIPAPKKPESGTESKFRPEFSWNCNLVSCNEQIVGSLLCNYSFAESAKACYSTDAYFNLHMGRKHKEMLHRSKIQKMSNVSLPEHNDECDCGDQDNDTTECFDDGTSLIVDFVPEEEKESEVKEDDDSVPTLVPRTSDDDESMISFEGDDGGKESNDDNEEESVIIPNSQVMPSLTLITYPLATMISLLFGTQHTIAWTAGLLI